MNRTSDQSASDRTGLARALSKLGFCSRSQAVIFIQSGHVRVEGIVVRDPEKRVPWKTSRIEVNGHILRKEEMVYLMLNKPRGLITTASDEKGRGTVFECLAGKSLPFVSPVGRLDKASEGLLLFTNDTKWAARISDPDSHIEKTYHVQIGTIANQELISLLVRGVRIEDEQLKVKQAVI